MKNSSFWISLLVFILLMCSCKSKEVATSCSKGLQVESDVSYLNESVKIDSSGTAYFAKEIQNIVIEEDIIATEYDKESGKPIKETKTKRKIAQDSDKVVAEEENQSVTNCNGLEIDHIADVRKKVESEVKEEVEGGQEAFGKWFGIVIGIAVSILSVYLLRKFRVN